MPSVLKYGRGTVIQLDMPATTVILDRPGPPGVPLDDPAAAVAAALASPRDFPPLKRAITPDDRVALALAPGVPQAEAIVAGVVYALCEAGISPANICIVCDADESQCNRDEIAYGLPPEIRTQVMFVPHQPHERSELAYLAASEDGQAIYFSREISDADLVIPIYCLRASGVLGHTELNEGLYPTFADADAQRRFRALSSSDVSAKYDKREQEANEAAWLLGVMLTVGVVPGGGGDVLHVIAGERNTVAAESRRLCEQAWAFGVPQRAELVVATVAGGPEQQTWENFGRALYAASQVATADGAILICCDLEHPPGPSMQRLAAFDAGEQAMREIRRDCNADTLAAAQLWRTLETNRVYLRSQLPAEVVESLGMAHVSSNEEIRRLSESHASCILFGNAQFAVPRVD